MRADLFLVQNGYAQSRTKAAALITSGAVKIGGRLVSKPSEQIEGDGHTVEIAECDETKYVSRGGLKLEAALDSFAIDVAEFNCIDIGASSGGFTDVLLRRGAARVTALDSGHGQLDARLAGDSRVTSLEGINAREMTPEMFENKFDIAVMDVSFISQTLILPCIPPLLKDGATLISLVKPQFEVGRANIGRGGIVKDEKVRKEALRRVIEFAQGCGFCAKNMITSPIQGGDGNVEYLVHFVKKPTEVI